jgi:hypothetical protein
MSSNSLNKNLNAKKKPGNVSTKAFNKYYKKQETSLDKLFQGMSLSESEFEFESPDIEVM